MMPTIIPAPGRPPRHRRRVIARALRGGCVLVLAALALSAPRTHGGWSAGVLAQTASAAAGTLAFSHTYASTSCTGSGPVSMVACPGSPAPVTPASTTTRTTSDVLADTSSTPSAAAFTHQVQVLSCAPAQFADARGNDADPLLPRTGVARQIADPWGGSAAARFDGGADYAADVVATSTAAVSSSSYSLGVGFRAAAGSSGGGLLSLNASPVDTTTAGADPVLYVDSSGRLRFKADGFLGIPVTVASPVSSLDGAWHRAVVTVLRNSLTTDVRLYLDGVQVDATLGASLLTGTLTASYWHLGWADTTLLAGSPRPYFTGDLSGAFIAPTALPAATVASTAAAATSTSYASVLAGAGATHVWMLGDPVTSTFGAALGFVSGGRPCADVTLAASLGGTTAFTATPLNSLAGAGWRPTTPVSAPGVGNSQTLTWSYARVSFGYDSDVTGLELVAPLAHQVTLTGSAWTLRFDWSAAVFLG